MQWCCGRTPHGSLAVVVDDGRNREQFTLDRPSLGLHIPPMVWATHAVLPFRAMLESRLCVVDEPLVQYRLHEGNLFFGKKTRRRNKLPREKAGRWAHSDLAIAQDWLRCWDLSGRQDDSLRQRLARFVQWRQLVLDGYARSRLGGIGVALRSRAAGLPLRESGGVFRRHVLRF